MIVNRSKGTQSRREFLKASTAVAAGTPFWFSTETSHAAAFASPNERPVLGCIGTGGQWQDDGPRALPFFDCVALCDVDTDHSAVALKVVNARQAQKGKSRHVDIYGDYRKLLDRKDINVVTIVTPDHWHTKLAIEAMQAGKDVYCEKPLTLTIDEGKQIIKVLNETKCVFQVGTQQRSEMRQNFLKAVAIVLDGRIGKLKRAVVDIGQVKPDGPFKKTNPPPNLNWDMWLGQAPRVKYIPERCHYQFRWWYEYSGGKMTDWGAHHVDIAQWAITGDEMAHMGPTNIIPVHAEHPVLLKNGYPTVDDRFNTATAFTIRCQFANGAEISIQDSSPDGSGVLFEGTKGKFHVGRSLASFHGDPVDELWSKPLPQDLLKRLCKGKKPGNHMANFAECVKTRDQPISDVYTHHRAITTCHLANIAIRLGRSITWDPKTEQIIGDKEAQLMQSREQRKGYEIND